MDLAALDYLLPPPVTSSADWLPQHVRMPPGTETAGLPFSFHQFPHALGVCQAFDDPAVRRIALQWGTRLGKTTTCLSLLARAAAVDPRNMFFACPTKDAARRVVKSRLYPLLEHTRGLAEQLPPPHLRSALEVRLAACTIFVGWSGSETSLADVGAMVGVANEIDKWTSEASDEADPLALFANRFKGFLRHKIIFESTPTIEGRSRIEREMRHSQQLRRWCPCPHCGQFQVLRKGRRDQPGGIQWSRDAAGHSTPEQAAATAYYQCAHCRDRIEDHHRVPMLRAGIWCPEGQRVEPDGSLAGQPLTPDRSRLGFGPLPSFYALTETWGSFARQWVAAGRQPRQLQDVVNSYLAETWKVSTSETTPEGLGARLGTDEPRRLVPSWGLFLVLAVDVQLDSYPFVVLACGAADQNHLVDYGQLADWQEVQQVLEQDYPHADRGQPLKISFAAVDSSYRTKEVYTWCRTQHRTARRVLPFKGSSTDLGGRPYRESPITSSNHTRRAEVRDPRSLRLVQLGIDYWETHLQAMLDRGKPGEPASLTLNAEAARDYYLLEQLLNGTMADRTDSRGNTKLLWVKRDPNLANDFRDAVKMALCGRQLYLDARRGHLPPRNQPPAKPAGPRRPRLTTPDGRPYFVTDR